MSKKKLLRKSFLNKKIKLQKSNFNPDFYYIISSSSSYITKKQLESCLRIISYYIRKSRRYFYTCLNFTIPITKKPKFSRMGSGKGRIRKMVARIHMNSILFIFKKTVNYTKLWKAFKAIQHRLPVKIHLY